MKQVDSVSHSKIAVIQSQLRLHKQGHARSKQDTILLPGHSLIRTQMVW